MKEIKFKYLNEDSSCNLLNKEYSRWGCCCKCANCLEVTKNCWHSPRDKLCVCRESLEFYVCILSYNMGETQTCNLSGKHGVCECFQPMNLLRCKR
jgi:hypothetical protein